MSQIGEGSFRYFISGSYPLNPPEGGLAYAHTALSQASQLATEFSNKEVSLNPLQGFGGLNFIRHSFQRQFRILKNFLRFHFEFLQRIILAAEMADQ